MKKLINFFILILIKIIKKLILIIRWGFGDWGVGGGDWGVGWVLSGWLLGIGEFWTGG